MLVSSIRAWLQRIPRLSPCLDASCHGQDLRIAHLLQVGSRQDRSISSTTIENNFRVFIRNHFLDITFENPPAFVNSPLGITLRNFTIFPNIDKMKGFTTFEASHDLTRPALTNVAFSYLNQPFESRIMPHHNVTFMQDPSFYVNKPKRRQPQKPSAGP